jgi:hypothetical protein
VDVSRRRYIESLESAIGDPRSGLDQDLFRFVSRMTPLGKVDMLIQDEPFMRVRANVLEAQCPYARFFR